MPGGLGVPILSYDNLRRRAEDFLREYHRSGAIPVPIEEIVELRFRIDIIPFPELQAKFEVDGFISSDLTAIYVDEFVYHERPGRYHFTLAHELAHAVLHRRIYQAHKFQSIEEWRRFQERIAESDRRWLEWQAYALGGLILVPPEPLREFYRKAVRAATNAGLSLQKAGEVALTYIAEWISRRFDVSRQVIVKRLRYDGLWPLPQA